MATATAPKKVKLEDIDLVLRDAQVCNVQLYYFQRLLDKPDVDETRCAEIESKCSTIFRDMMSHLYSVLDQIYYFLHCHYQNNGDVSLKHDAWQIKQPIKQDLKWSPDNTRDQQSECKKKRNDWVTDQCTKIFGNYNFPESKRNDVRHFQNGLLQLQAIKKVYSSGEEVLAAFYGKPECEWVTDQCKKIFGDDWSEGESYVKAFLEKLPQPQATDDRSGEVLRFNSEPDVEFKKKRNEWVTNQCKKIFGDQCPTTTKGKSYVRAFQEDLQRLQAIRKVNRSGGEALRVDSGSDGEPDDCNDWLTDQCKKIFGDNCQNCESCVRKFLENLLRLQADKGPTLLRPVDFEHDAAGSILQFSPSNVRFEELRSVKNTHDWNPTIQFNLLHFFRNFTAHRSLIECKIKEGYWNVETREFKPADQHLPEPWIQIAKGAWILVPELSHLRQVGRESFPTCYPHPLIIVSNSLLDFVKWQRNEVVRVLNKAEDYRYEVNRFEDGFVTFKEKGELIGKCQWEKAHLWPGVKT